MALVSLHGRALGFDSDVGQLVYNGETEGLTTAPSTATNISNRGFTSLGSSANKDFTMAAPIAGVVKTLAYGAATTGAQTVTLASGTFVSTSGSSQNRATLDSTGKAITLQGLSTSKFQVVGNTGAVAFTTA